MAASILATPRSRRKTSPARSRIDIANKLDKTVYVKSDARAKYGDVVAVVDEIRSAGVDSLGLLTEKTKALGALQTPAAPKPAGA